MTKQDVVNSGVTTFALLEGALRQVKQSLTDLDGLATDANSTGLFTWGQATDIQAQLADMASQVSQHYADVIKLHQACTKLAQAQGVDIVDPNSGGTRSA